MNEEYTYGDKWGDVPPAKHLGAVERAVADSQSAMEPSDAVTLAVNVAPPELIAKIANQREDGPILRVVEDTDHNTDRVILDMDEARRIANILEMHYEHTEADSYEVTADDAARDAMILRTRGGIEPNPDLIDETE